MDPLWIAIAYLLGLAAQQLGLPPLVGFLVAGFGLGAFGAESGELLPAVAELGVTLLLFTIGLKLNVRTLLKPQIWGVASLHMGITVLVTTLLLAGLAALQMPPFADLPLTSAALLAFALSFSSTVFAVKVLEEKGELASNHGRTAIGILIMQDIAAVVFLAASTGKIPTPWAIGLIALIPLRPFVLRLMVRSGHGELLILYGLMLALGSYAVFELVQIKGDLGALLVGMLLAGHPKSGELAKALLGFKDLFLVGFFLSIGMSGNLDLAAAGIAIMLVLLVPLKAVLFFWLMTRFHLRARTSLLASLSLANISEFGLIVAAVGASTGLLSPDWLAILAIALALSFVLASPLQPMSHAIYDRLHDTLVGLETEHILADDLPVDPGEAEILIFGMGRIGTGAYDTMLQRVGAVVLGLDVDEATVAAHREAGRSVIRDDATDPDFWTKLRPGRVRLVMLALPNHKENLVAAEQLRHIGFTGQVAAIAYYGDQVEELREAGVHAAFNAFAEAGSGFANHVCDQITKAAAPAAAEQGIEAGRA